MGELIFRLPYVCDVVDISQSVIVIYTIVLLLESLPNPCGSLMVTLVPNDASNVTLESLTIFSSVVSSVRSHVQDGINCGLFPIPVLDSDPMS